jgi:hypothetical protein
MVHEMKAYKLEFVLFIKQVSSPKLLAKFLLNIVSGIYTERYRVNLIFSFDIETGLRVGQPRSLGSIPGRYKRSYRIWDSQSSGYEESYLLRHKAV